MNLYLLLVTLTLFNTGVVPDTECERVLFDGKYYDKEILKTNLRVLINLVVDYSANILYFSYFNDMNDNSALIDLNTKIFKDINDVPDGYTQAVDQNTHAIYIGGNNGIYKYDPKNHNSELYAAKGKVIWSVYFKDVLYFSDNSYGFMYTCIDGNIKKSKDLEDIKIYKFVIDGEDVMFYFNETGLYGQKKGSKDAVLYSDKDVNALTVDVHGNAYMCDEEAIYKIDKKSSSLEKMMDANECRGLAFDANDNVIYSTYSSLIYLTRKGTVTGSDNNKSYIVSPSLSSNVLKNNKDKTCSIFSPFVVLMLGLLHLGL